MYVVSVPNTILPQTLTKTCSVPSQRSGVGNHDDEAEPCGDMGGDMVGGNMGGNMQGGRGANASVHVRHTMLVPG